MYLANNKIDWSKKTIWQKYQGKPKYQQNMLHLISWKCYRNQVTNNNYGMLKMQYINYYTNSHHPFFLSKN
jgi:hypothetical protein